MKSSREDRPFLKTPITSLLCALEIVFNSVYVCLSMCWHIHGTAGTLRVLQGIQSPLELVVSYCESPGAGAGNQTRALEKISTFCGISPASLFCFVTVASG